LFGEKVIELPKEDIKVTNNGSSNKGNVDVESVANKQDSEYVGKKEDGITTLKELDKDLKDGNVVTYDIETSDLISNGVMPNVVELSTISKNAKGDVVHSTTKAKFEDKVSYNSYISKFSKEAVKAAEAIVSKAQHALDNTKLAKDSEGYTVLVSALNKATKDYNAILAINNSSTYKTAAKGMGHWNNLTDTVSKSELVKKFHALSKGKKLMGFNNKKFDDRVMSDLFTKDGLDTAALDNSYDLRRIHLQVNNKGKDTSGKLTELSNYHKENGSETDAHSAEYDTLVTEKLAHEFIDKHLGKTNDNTDSKGLKFIKSLNMGSSKTPIIDAFLMLQDNMNTKIITGSKVSQFISKHNTIELEGKPDSEVVEHEILHAFTTLWIENQDRLKEKGESSYRYLSNALPILRDKLLNMPIEDISKLSDEQQEAISRVRYSLEKSNDKEAIAELISILGAERSTANNIYSILQGRRSNRNLAKRLKDVIERITKNVIGNVKRLFIGEAEVKRIKDGVISVRDFSMAVEDSIMKSIDSIKKDKNFNDNIKKVDVKLGIAPQGLLPKVDKAVNNKINYINRLSERMLTSPFERKATTITKNIDTMLEAFPMYLEAKNLALGMYNNSDALQQFIEYVKTPDKLIGKKNDFLTYDNKLKKETQDRTNAALNKIHHLTSDFTEDGKNILSDITSLVPLQYIFRDYPTLGSSKEFSTKLKELEDSTNDKDLQFLDNLVSMLIDGDVKDAEHYSVRSKFADGPNTNKYEAILALKSLAKVDPGFKNISNIAKNHTELYDIIKDNSMALHVMHKELTEGEITKDIQVVPHYEEITERRLFSWNDRHQYQYEASSGWKILEKATKEGVMGVAYRTIIDKQQAQGAGLDVMLPTQDIMVPARYVNDPKVKMSRNNVVKVGDGYRYILTPKQHNIIGKVKAPAENLVMEVKKLMS